MALSESLLRLYPFAKPMREFQPCRFVVQWLRRYDAGFTKFFETESRATFAFISNCHKLWSINFEHVAAIYGFIKNLVHRGIVAERGAAVRALA